VDAGVDMIKAVPKGYIPIFLEFFESQNSFKELRISDVLVSVYVGAVFIVRIISSRSAKEANLLLPFTQTFNFL
jgi:hypothetical protein